MKPTAKFFILPCLGYIPKHVVLNSEPAYTSLHPPKFPYDICCDVCSQFFFLLICDSFKFCKEIKDFLL